MYPWVYIGRYTEEHIWKDEYIEKPHASWDEENFMDEKKRNSLLASRNSFPELPLVGYTSQYGLGCFEGLKAYPQRDGSLKLFRPDENGKRMAMSMEGLLMPPFPADRFVQAVTTVVKKNKAIGFAPAYDAAWEKDHFVSGHSVYIRPFTWSEGAIGLGVSKFPSVVVVATPVSTYFDSGNAKAVTTDRVRATHRGTGWIKCDSNYVIPIIAKKEAQAAGYMEAVFLDAAEKKYVEEGSSCNIFFLLKSGTLVTPELSDTILPGINRKSVITLATDMGVKVEERKVPLDEVMAEAIECFVTGTAAGVSYIESLTHGRKTTVFSGGKIGELTMELLKKLKGIQYGALPDTYGWMFPV